MRLSIRDQQFSMRRLTGLYIGALSAIALLGQLVIQLSLIQQSSDANVINIAGRQSAHA